MNRLSRWAPAAVVSGGLGLAGVGLSVLGLGTADADPVFGPSYEGGNCPNGVTCTPWCPGDPPIPGSHVITWDWNICHDWYWNPEGTVDVATNIVYPWHGVPHQAAPPPQPVGPPPPLPPRPADCPPFNIPFLAPSRCGGL